MHTPTVPSTQSAAASFFPIFSQTQSNFNTFDVCSLSPFSFGLEAYKNLSPKTRLGVGVAILAWGAGGLMLADTVEETLGLTPTEEDKAKLDKYTPKIITVEKDEKSEN
ncbi:hypothetical protein B0J15DRAFT_540303 [Fusarium solani]|uniref:Uncharacterized protein n=1 Tax=Fusarium solani TaxID=169388 RepID=A0A9P9L7E8_FUSSL|nr:uncharacterized protein B0J15DRAFT_540303 [Fusarium solani]KAH7275269.1 hypothetical protein B0J15DRAFT_540303 [Fusarium solani]